MSGVEIHHSHGWGMYCYSLLGNSNISHTKINGGHYITNYSGGNLRFKYRGVSDRTINVAISYSTFENGAENIADRNTYAGGVDIYLLTRNKINMLFYNVQFYNNSGYDGGNVAISYTTLDNGWNSSVTFNECTFVKGYAEHFGGGLYMEAILRTNTSLKYFNSSRTILTLVAVNFTNNIYSKNSRCWVLLASS